MIDEDCPTLVVDGIEHHGADGPVVGEQVHEGQKQEHQPNARLWTVQERADEHSNEQPNERHRGLEVKKSRQGTS